jgi:hypothetical protein
MKTLTTLLLALVVAAPAVAQEQEIRTANLPPALETRLLSMYDGAAARYDGPTVIRAGDHVSGDIAATTGPLRVAGRVEGHIAMVGGDVVLEPGGHVVGSITVIGGEVRMAEGAVAEGSITVYGPSPSPKEVESGRDRRRDRSPERERDPHSGYSRFTVRAGPSYNRVEGLPVMFGPILETAGTHPLRLEALAIWRTEAGASVETERMGYRVTAEQFLAPERRLSIGATLHSVVEPLDRWQLSDLEASLAAALFRQDYRDHFERAGWSAFVRARPMAGLDARVTYRDERHAALPSSDPWSLFNQSGNWRLQPLIAGGHVRSLGASVELDRRDRFEARGAARSGWLARASVERPLGGSLTRPALDAVSSDPAHEDPVTGYIPAAPADLDFTTGLVEVRRYTPIGRHSRLNMRVLAGGSLTGSALPPQYQHALGGPGTLPGFDTFHGDCGARRAAGEHEGDRYFPAYGCDRFALAQVEYRGNLALGFQIGEHRAGARDWPRHISIDASPTWVMFVDAGRGWAYVDDAAALQPRGTGTLVDAGVGISLGKLGLYAAVPLNDHAEQSPRFFLRWGARF